MVYQHITDLEKTLLDKETCLKLLSCVCKVQPPVRRCRPAATIKTSLVWHAMFMVYKFVFSIQERLKISAH